MKSIIIFTCFLLLLPTVTFGQAKLSEKISKRIADATPKSLPQSPVAPKLTSDAEDQNLKGKVMTVIKENEDLSQSSTVQGRHFKSITDFDENGNRVKAVYFSDNGNPYAVSVFGYLDGARVSSHNTIYEDSGIFSGGAPLGEGPTVSPSPDPRYSYKYAYKYIGRKLSEMQLYLSTGEMVMRHVYIYMGNRMEELAYDSDGKLNQKYITVFNPKGDEVEWHAIAVINLPRPDRKYFIKTETFDKEGNWTKRTFFKATTETGKETHVPERIEYRQIKYYVKRKPEKQIKRTGN